MKNISLIVSFIMGLFGKNASLKRGKSLLDLVKVLRSQERVSTRRIAAGAPCPSIIVELLYDPVAVAFRDRWAVGLTVPKYVVIESLDELQRVINSLAKIESASYSNGGYAVVYSWNVMIVPPLRGNDADGALSLIAPAEARFQAMMAKPTSDEEKARALAARAARIAKYKENVTG